MKKLETFINKNMEQAKVGVAVIISRVSYGKREILIGKRKGSHGSGVFSVPGGHLEFGETCKQACSRELEEEIGVSFDFYKKIGFSEDFFSEENKHYITLYFLVKDIENHIVKEIKNLEPEKCEEWIWKDVNYLPKLFCNTNEIIKEIHENGF